MFRDDWRAIPEGLISEQIDVVLLAVPLRFHIEEESEEPGGNLVFQAASEGP